jgi:hypothetical protein
VSRRAPRELLVLLAILVGVVALLSIHVVHGIVTGRVARTVSREDVASKVVSFDHLPRNEVRFRHPSGAEDSIALGRVCFAARRNVRTGMTLRVRWRTVRYVGTPGTTLLVDGVAARRLCID